MDAGLQELERMAMAASAGDAQIADEKPSQECIERWTTLFGYSQQEAVHLISSQRSDVTRERISDEHWALVKDEKEALGYDREAYEHSLQLLNVFKDQSTTLPSITTDGEPLFLFRLGGLLDTPQKVKDVAQLEKLPMVREGSNERGVVKFCEVNQDAKEKLEEWLKQRAVLQK